MSVVFLCGADVLQQFLAAWLLGKPTAKACGFLFHCSYATTTTWLLGKVATTVCSCAIAATWLLKKLATAAL
jgi:hypothetical protein